MRAPITVNLMGGLGNQLFQFATGLEVAYRSKTELVLDLSWYQQKARRSNGLTLRDFELKDIAQGVEILNRSPNIVQSYARHGRDVLLRRVPPRVSQFVPRIYVEKLPYFDERVLGLRAGSELIGYFSSWKYFPSVANDVRERISSSSSGSQWLQSELKEIRLQNAIVLHIRRGDYLTLNSTYGHLTPAYYCRAVEVLRRLGHVGQVWIMSDDPVGAMNWLSPYLEVDRVINPPDSSTSTESLVLMSEANALVIANSTFSWWAAFLNPSSGRSVIAPRPQWADLTIRDSRDLYLPDWLTVDSR